MLKAIPLTTHGTFSGRASSNATPSIVVKKLIRFGGRPIWWTMSGCVKDSGVIAAHASGSLSPRLPTHSAVAARHPCEHDPFAQVIRDVSCERAF